LILYRVVVHRGFARRLTAKIRETLRKSLHFERIQIEEILQQSEGYGIAFVLIEKISHIAGLPLGQSGLRERVSDSAV
jgi:RNA 3'-terminal phosphate cyclase